MIRLPSFRLALTLFLFTLLPFAVQAQFSLDGEYRPRTEYRDGYRLLDTPEADPAFFVSQRTRLGLQYEGDGYTFRLSAQDVRVWGEVAQLQDNASVNIHEAWARLKAAGNLHLKLGRQELVYDDQRLLGSVNWTQQARSHDALVIQYRDPQSELNLHAGGAYNQQGENLLANTYAVNNYKTLAYLWANKRFGDLSASALWLSDGFQVDENSTSFRYTWGTHLDWNPGRWQLVGSAYHQGGDDRTRRNISAYLLAASISYQWESLELSAGYDYLSGGSTADANPSRHAFHTLYATNHKFYGNMDYFLNVPADTRGGGLQDAWLGTRLRLGARSTAGLTWHYFTLAGEIADPGNPSTALDPYLGSELDASLSHAVSEEVSLRVGYSVLFNGRSLDRLQGRNADSGQHWAWVMLRVQPTLFRE
ncbi:MAG: alginate export family protein [Balneolaceae bacterium]|nr:alginate export family protein [Balneolaceae bacterium]